MRSDPGSRHLMARHEAAHLTAQMAAGRPSRMLWRSCGQGREICHCSASKWAGQWEDPEVRNAHIAANAFVALAGGAWEAVEDGGSGWSIGEVHRLAGAIDFELAHEWLTLQRYDGDQQAIESDIERLFGAASEFLRGPLQQRAVRLIAGRLLDEIERVECLGETFVDIRADRLTRGISLASMHPLVLKATVRQ